MAVAYDAVAKGSGNGSNALALSGLTTGGTDRMGYIWVHVSNTSAISSITGGSGVTWARVGSAYSLASNGQMELWKAYLAASQSAVVFTVNTSGFPQITAVCMAFSGADVTSSGANANGTPVTATGLSTAPSASVTTTANNSLVVGGVGETSNASMTAGSNQTIRDTASGVTAFSQTSGITQNAVTASSGSSVTINETLGSSQRWGVIAFEIKDGGGGGGNTTNFFF